MCEATVTAIGPFSKEISSVLEYGGLEKEWGFDSYKGVEEGAVVLSTVFLAVGTSHSVKLAHCFGVGLWEFGRHLLDSDRADLDTLRKEFSDEEVDNFVVLRSAGFQFYFQPNG